MTYGIKKYKKQRVREKYYDFQITNLDNLSSGPPIYGIGYGKIEFLNAELGEGVAIMRDIKRALDPGNIMNPGKILQM